MPARVPPTILTPADEAEWLRWRAEDITSTECAALFGVSPYETAYALWHRKRGTLTREFPDTERMKWGRRLEASIAAGVAEDHGLTIVPMKQYARHGSVPRLGASFDYSIEGGANIDPAAGKGILEIKNVDARVASQQWDIDGEEEIGEAPAHIELQHQHQLEVMDRDYGYIAALFGGNRLAVIYRERDRVVGAQIRERVAAFWASIDAGTEPAPDFTRDAESIARLHGYSEPGKLLDWRIDAPDRAIDLLDRYAALGADAKRIADERDAVKAELLTLVGDAEKVLSPLGALSLSMVGPARVEYDRKPYRSFKFTPSRKPLTTTQE
jgi:putative phage-type endonuclease